MQGRTSLYFDLGYGGCRRVMSRGPVESSEFSTGKDEFYVLTSPLAQLISLTLHLISYRIHRILFLNFTMFL